MRKVAPSRVEAGHPDFDILERFAREIEARLGSRLIDAFVLAMLDAIEFVLDPVRTGRTRIADLDNVEKTFVGLKIEHYVRDLLDAPKDVRDLKLLGHDVDIKNTVSRSWSWMIPPESYREAEPVMLLAADEDDRASWMGLMLCREEYLGAPNRDGKRGVLSGAYPNILWLAAGVRWPKSRWDGLDMKRFRELRQIKIGKQRAAQFFLENDRRITHREVLVALLFDQKDPMKRLRKNGGAPDLLLPRDVMLLSGRYNAPLAKRLGFTLLPEEFVAVTVQTEAEFQIFKQAKELL
ncbi:MAG: hypothetical protein EON59_09075 [Alphaproteobacteria bacterium]|nr:MAG: hypothetical protein EON59_09075 [Alphaproteobacteria bacterium]